MLVLVVDGRVVAAGGGGGVRLGAPLLRGEGTTLGEPEGFAIQSRRGNRRGGVGSASRPRRTFLAALLAWETGEPEVLAPPEGFALPLPPRLDLPEVPAAPPPRSPRRCREPPPPPRRGRGETTARARAKPPAAKSEAREDATPRIVTPRRAARAEGAPVDARDAVDVVASMVTSDVAQRNDVCFVAPRRWAVTRKLKKI